MLSGKHTEDSASHSESDRFSVTRQKVQARLLEEVIQKKTQRNPMDLKYNCLFCSEVCAQHNPACRHSRDAQSKEADKWTNFRGQEALMPALLGAAIRLHCNLWALTAKKCCAALRDTITRLTSWGQRGGKGRERGQITSWLTLVLVQHLSLNIFFFPLN